MSILINEETRVLVQGITGKEGAFHTNQMLLYGTKIVAGVTPGKGGSKAEGIPVFNTVSKAVEETGANASIIFVPPSVAADAILEAADENIKVIVCISEGIPTFDMIYVMKYIEGKDIRLIGPNCPGIISPDKCKLGIMPGHIHKKGNIGIISRSGTLTYEVVYQLTERGIGQSTCIGIGGDPIIGSNFVDCLKLFKEDSETLAICLIGEIGGTTEEDAAKYIKEDFPKPVIGYIAGMTAPPGRRMGHAGAIIAGGRGTAKEKVNALKASGVFISESPALVGKLVEDVIKKRI
jgi:succinyl-CoA synthetase alpha subunit